MINIVYSTPEYRRQHLEVSEHALERSRSNYSISERGQIKSVNGQKIMYIGHDILMRGWRYFWA